jgi:ribonuclease-3
VAARRDRLLQVLGCQFEDDSLLELALTHRSCGAVNNERLEFLGDAVLNQVIAAALYRQFPDASEGDLSRMRAALVRGETLAELALELELSDHILLGQGEMKSGGRRRASILADCLEAIIGAMSLDAERALVEERLLAWFGSRLEEVSPAQAAKDPKTTLQEYLQGRGMPLPDYQLLQIDGEDHRQQFTVRCHLPDLGLELDGAGSSRRRAEQAAADAALEALGEYG